MNDYYSKVGFFPKADTPQAPGSGGPGESSRRSPPTSQQDLGSGKLEYNDGRLDLGRTKLLERFQHDLQKEFAKEQEKLFEVCKSMSPNSGGICGHPLDGTRSSYLEHIMTSHRDQPKQCQDDSCRDKEGRPRWPRSIPNLRYLIDIHHLTHLPNNEVCKKCPFAWRDPARKSRHAKVHRDWTSEDKVKGYRECRFCLGIFSPDRKGGWEEHMQSEVDLHAKYGVLDEMKSISWEKHWILPWSRETGVIGKIPKDLDDSKSKEIAPFGFPGAILTLELPAMGPLPALEIEDGTWMCECGKSFKDADKDQYTKHSFKAHWRRPCEADNKCPDISITTQDLDEHMSRSHGLAPRTKGAKEVVSKMSGEPRTLCGASEPCSAIYAGRLGSEWASKHNDRHLLKRHLVAAYRLSGSEAGDIDLNRLAPPEICHQKRDNGESCGTMLFGIRQWVTHVKNNQAVHEKQSSIACQFPKCKTTVPTAKFPKHVEENHLFANHLCPLPACPERFTTPVDATKHAIVDHVRVFDQKTIFACPKPGCGYRAKMAENDQSQHEVERKAREHSQKHEDAAGIKRGEDIYGNPCPVDHCPFAHTSVRLVTQHVSDHHKRQARANDVHCFICQAYIVSLHDRKVFHRFHIHMDEHEQYYKKYGLWPRDFPEATYEKRVKEEEARIESLQPDRYQPRSYGRGDDDDSNDGPGDRRRPRDETRPDETRRSRSPDRTLPGQTGQRQSGDRSGQGQTRQADQTRDSGNKEKSQAGEKWREHANDTTNSNSGSSSRTSSVRSSQRLSRTARNRDPSTSSSVSTMDEKAKRSDKTGTGEGHGKSSTATSTLDTCNSKVVARSVDTKLTKSSRERAEPSLSSTDTKLARMTIKEGRITTAKHAPASGPSTQSPIPSGPKTVVKGTRKDKTAKTKVQKEKAPA